MDYISHLDALNSEANANILASWSNYSNLNRETDSLVEQLQTTLDVEQLLSIYLSAITSHYKINSVELDTFHGKFKSSNGQSSSQTMTLPIRINDRLMGRISYFSEKPITDILMSSLTGYQKKLIYPLRNALAFWQLQQMALKDPLTGIGNRSMYEDAIERKFQHAERFNEEFVLMLLDLDNFKNVNDTHGHLQGDDILTSFVQLVEECLRGTDQVFRFGGDEFAILLEKEGLNGAHIVAARINHAISQSPIFNKFNVSTSIGCACFTKNDTPKDLFARADKALYAAKDAGKNCMKIA
ncbi:GGDEF domain-containing protein [Psychrosphaera aquimarina]|uniref:diguanylate cyclase n=1 Tax=Psychrosphaera aquimarina TaxID=2044854 RepID=A0ABU3R0Q8_9GAMM|nr:GGDEF domain-containing protein [Psychrosphaera aquimarina]MDU0113253.1 GGDEF domain-containing protein [Psychrosphaera aquimarina]